MMKVSKLDQEQPLDRNIDNATSNEERGGCKAAKLRIESINQSIDLTRIDEKLWPLHVVACGLLKSAPCLTISQGLKEKPLESCHCMGLASTRPKTSLNACCNEIQSQNNRVEESERRMELKKE